MKCLRKKHLKGVINYDDLLLSLIILIIFLLLPFYFFKISPPNYPSGKRLFSRLFDAFHCLNQDWKRTSWPVCDWQDVIFSGLVYWHHELLYPFIFNVSECGVFQVILVKWLWQPVELARYYILTIKTLKLSQELLYSLCCAAKFLFRRGLKNVETFLKYGYQFILCQHPRTESVTGDVI